MAGTKIIIEISINLAGEKGCKYFNSVLFTFCYECKYFHSISLIFMTFLIWTYRADRKQSKAP